MPFKVKPPRKIWRISKQAPLGEWVTPSAPPIGPPRADLLEVSYGSWVTSSFDLASGAEIAEVTDTIPGELFDELFDSPAKNQKRSRG